MGDTFYKTFDQNGNFIRLIPAAQLDILSKFEYIKGVSCLVIQDGKLLFEKRSQQQDGSGYLDFCSGKVNGNETSEQAMIRELSEELGIKEELARNITHLKSYQATLDNRRQIKNWLIDFYYLQLPPDYETRRQKSEIDSIIALPLPNAFEVIRNSEDFNFPQDKNMEMVLKKLKGHLFLDKMTQAASLQEAANNPKQFPTLPPSTRPQEKEKP